MVERIFEAKVENLQDVLAFVDGHLESLGCSVKTQMQIDIAVEEIFVNIAQYAYVGGTGKAKINLEILENPLRFSITFIDKGIAYDPLEKPDPDISLSAQQRQIGGLGIFMAKMSMDDMLYKRKDGQNILTFLKNL